MQDDIKQRLEDNVTAGLRDTINAYRSRHQITDQEEGEQAEQRTDFDGGARTTAPQPPDMSALIRRAAGF
jgi:hypothetical protein